MTVKKNLIAGFVSRGWSVFISIILTPIYIKFLGIESYGLIGFMIFLQGILSACDLGFGGIVIRQMAVLSTHERNSELRNLLRTGEILYWTFAATIAIVMVFASEFLVVFWLKTSSIKPDVLKNLLLLIGINLALQWPSFLYLNALLGLQKQVLLNVLIIGLHTLRSAGAILVLMVIPTMQAFMIWQIVVSLIQSLLSRIILLRNIPSSMSQAFFDWELLKQLKSSIFGFGGVTFLGLILSVSDKFILSKILSLKEYGYYCFASVIAGGIYSLVSPISHVYFPHYSKLNSLDDLNGLKNSYHESSQLLSVITFSVAIFFIFFSKELLSLWTKNPILVENSQMIAIFLIIGTTFNGLANLPSFLQMAHGWTNLTFWMHLSAIACMVPLMFFSYQYWGLNGAACGFMILYGIYLIIYINFMHKKLLRDDKRSWWINDVGTPLAAAMIVPLLGKLFLLRCPLEKGMFAFLFVLALTALAFTAFSTKYTRQMLRPILLKFSFGLWGK